MLDPGEGDSARGQFSGQWRGVVRPLLEWTCEAGVPRLDEPLTREPGWADSVPTRVSAMPPASLIGVYRRQNAAYVATLVEVAVEHRWRTAWWALDGAEPSLAHVTVGEGPGMRLALLNELTAYVPDEGYIVVSDDDVAFTQGSLPALVVLCDRARLDLAQPARSDGNLRFEFNVAHAITRPRRLSRVRLTTFVETGPLIVVGPTLADASPPVPGEPRDGMGRRARLVRALEGRMSARHRGRDPRCPSRGAGRRIRRGQGGIANSRGVGTATIRRLEGRSAHGQRLATMDEDAAVGRGRNGVTRISLSIVVSTYEWPEALDAVLRGFARQTDQAFELIVADDGSGALTAEVVDSWRASFGDRLSHAWQDDAGFRLARVRNLGAFAARGDYFVFVDGDCVPRRGFIASIRRAASPWVVPAESACTSTRSCRGEFSTTMSRLAAGPQRRSGFAAGRSTDGPTSRRATAVVRRGRAYPTSCLTAMRTAS